MTKVERWLSRREAAAYLTERGFKISHLTLQKMASVGGGPKYRIWGNRAIYGPPDLDEYAEDKLSAPRRSTSEMEAA